MRPLSPGELLAVWERGQGEPLYQQALLLLAAACPEESPDALAEISMGRRDARLLTLREWTFGSTLNGVSACPACGERAEISVQVRDVRMTPPDPAGDALTLALDGYHVDLRLPGTVDLQDVAGRGNAESVRSALIGRCILNARCNGEKVAANQLPAHVVESVIARMAELDPQADTELALACPGCGNRWHALFDIVSFFWGEIQAWALRTLREVHILASAYGWREADILAMHPLRRQSYLRMVGA